MPPVSATSINEMHRSDLSDSFSKQWKVKGTTRNYRGAFMTSGRPSQPAYEEDRRHTTALSLSKRFAWNYLPIAS
jgi:hypothetical protein